MIYIINHMIPLDQSFMAVVLMTETFIGRKILRSTSRHMTHCIYAFDDLWYLVSMIPYSN